MPDKLLQIIGDGRSKKRSPDVDLSDAQLKELHRWMLLVRTIDTKMLLVQRQGRIGFYGPITGQEASLIGSAYALQPQDWIFPALREGGACLLRGMPLDAFLAENFATSLSIQKGRQMPCHYSFKSGNVVAWSSCIGTQLPHAVGAAMAMKYRGDRAVSMAYLGDGATSESDFHVAANFAAVYRAPVVFFCQNNHWAISVPSRLQTASESFAIKAEAYGFPGFRVDGNDVLAVYKSAKDAIERARRGEGPTLIESLTYRIGPHSSSDDPTRYRDEAEVEAWRKRDPLERYRAYLANLGLWTKEWEAQTQDTLDADVAAAIERAEKSPPVAPETILDDVYEDVPAALRRELLDWQRSL